MKSTMLVSLLLVLLVSCVCSSDDFQPPVYAKYIDELINVHAKEVKKSEGLDLGAEGGAFAGEVKLFRLYYTSNRCVKIEEARRVYVNITEKFLDKLNSHVEIRPYLQKYPVDLENVRITIRFADCNNKTNEVETVNLSGSTIQYIQWITPFEHKVIYEEPYEKALKIVQAEKQASK